LIKSGGTKIIENNKKIRKTSIDLFTNYKQCGSYTPEKDSESKNSNNDIKRIKKNMILDVIDFPKAYNNWERNLNIYDLDVNLSLNAKPSSFKNKKYKNIDDESNPDKKDQSILLNINKQNSALPIHAEKNISDFYPDEKIKKKKKTSLLRRTTSVPKLVGHTYINHKEESNEKKSKITKLEQENNVFSPCLEINKDLKQKFIFEENRRNDDDTVHIHISHTEGENKFNSEDNTFKDIEDENEILTELNSPYNELFFYLFENLLEEYMRSRFN